MAREFRVVFYLGGEATGAILFESFRAARDWAAAEVDNYETEPDFCLSVEQREPGGPWRQMIPFGPASPVPPPNDIHAVCVLCYSRFRTSRVSLNGGLAQCPHCGASSVIEET